jgi:hypothetical protein
LLTEQNHVLQEHRQQLAALVERASRPQSAAPAATKAQTPIQPQPPLSTMQVAAPQRMPTSSPWTTPATVQRPLHTTQALAGTPGFWARLGRGFFSTFSPAYKD